MGPSCKRDAEEGDDGQLDMVMTVRMMRVGVYNEIQASWTMA